jgi:23S rRNA A1618 N6-methylase RlmF
MERKVFDYGSINDQHIEAAEEIVNILKQMNSPMEAELVMKKFNLTPRIIHNIEEYDVTKYCKENGIFLGVQGYVEENGNSYPIVTICSDIRKFKKLKPDND